MHYAYLSLKLSLFSCFPSPLSLSLFFFFSDRLSVSLSPVFVHWDPVWVFPITIRSLSARPVIH